MKQDYSYAKDALESAIETLIGKGGINERLNNAMQGRIHALVPSRNKDFPSELEPEWESLFQIILDRNKSDEAQSVAIAKRIFKIYQDLIKYDIQSI